MAHERGRSWHSLKMMISCELLIFILKCSHINHCIGIAEYFSPFGSLIGVELMMKNVELCEDAVRSWKRQNFFNSNHFRILKKEIRLKPTWKQLFQCVECMK
jgi:hypothetical protein